MLPPSLMGLFSFNFSEKHKSLIVNISLGMFNLVETVETVENVDSLLSMAINQTKSKCMDPLLSMIVSTFVTAHLNNT